MKRTPNMEKALRWFCEEYDLIPQLSTHPIYYFKDKDGVEEKHNIFVIVGAWERMRKEEKRDAKKR